jgi:lipopolysaccharide biosynthesis regulator YciM
MPATDAFIEMAAQSGGTTTLNVAVGTLVTQRPPHGSARAAFLHAALTADIWRRSAYQDTDEEAWVEGASA